MPIPDARSLSPLAKEALRKRAVQAYLTSGLTQTQVAAAFGVHRSALTNWLAAYRKDGDAALDAHPKGPAKGTRTLLTPKQAEQIRQLIIDKCPEQLKLPFYLCDKSQLL
jgi:transposase